MKTKKLKTDSQTVASVDGNATMETTKDLSPPSAPGKKPRTSNSCKTPSCEKSVYAFGLCGNHWRRLYRKKTGNLSTRKYEKTPNGFLMRLYRNMKSRVTGVQRKKYPLYVGKELLPKEEFYAWAKSSDVFWQLFSDWETAGYDQRLTPSVDRIDSDKGYTLDNIQWLTHSENSAKGNASRFYGAKAA